MNWKRKTNAEILNELGERIRGKRIQKRFKQSELAHCAGISVYTLQKIEYGKPCQLLTLIQVLRAMNELDQLDRFLPEVEISPIDMLDSQDKIRKRVRHPKNR